MRVTDNMRSWNPVAQTTGWDGPGIGAFSHLLQVQIPVLINAQTRGEKAKHFHLEAKMDMEPPSYYSNGPVALNIGVILITVDKNKLLKILITSYPLG